MTMPVRKLLVLGMLCWVAPLGAEQRSSTDVAPSDDSSGCPYARAEAEHAEQVVVIKADSPLLDPHAPASALLP